MMKPGEIWRSLLRRFASIIKSLANQLEQTADSTSSNLDRAAQILFQVPLPNLGSRSEQLAEEEHSILFGKDSKENHQTPLLQLERQRLNEKLELERDNRQLRKTLAKRIFRVTGSWLAGVYLVLLLVGFKVELISVFSWIKVSPFYLSDTVLTALLGATSVLGLLAIILRGLFLDKEDEKNDRKLEEPGVKSL